MWVNDKARKGNIYSLRNETVNYVVLQIDRACMRVAWTGMGASVLVWLLVAGFAAQSGDCVIPRQLRAAIIYWPELDNAYVQARDQIENSRGRE